MNVYTLIGPEYIDPAWFRKMSERSHAATVGDDGTILLDGECLRFVDGSLAAGTDVVVSLNRNITCQTLDDMHDEQRIATELAATYKEERKANAQAAGVAAATFNTSLNIPVRWDSGYKDVLSGLSATSNGCGTSKATVVHIRLLQALSSGRLSRNAGDFLCTSAGGSNGKQWSSTNALSHDGVQEYPSMVTCKKCIEIAQRLNKTAA